MIVIPGCFERKAGVKYVLSIILNQYFPHMGKGRESQIKEGQRTPNRLNYKLSSPQHIIIKTSSVEHKEKVLRYTCKKKNIR